MTEALNSAGLQRLLRQRDRWVDIVINIDTVDQGIKVSSSHRASDGTTSHTFEIMWDDPERVCTEYAAGISLIHDVKDHYFYGLGITTLSEFQTIVQTYLGRALALGGLAACQEYGERLVVEAVHNELFGPRGPRVYDPREEGY